MINGVNNYQVGEFVRYALDNPKSIGSIWFRSIAFNDHNEKLGREAQLLFPELLTPIPLASRLALSNFGELDSNTMCSINVESDSYPVFNSSHFASDSDPT